MKPTTTFVIACLFFLFSQQNTNAQCTALYTFDMQGVNVDFTDLSSTTTGTINSWFWDFGDGTTSTLQNPSHTFPEIEDFDVCLTITTTTGCTNQICSEVEPCDLSISLNVGDCDANDEVQLDITIFDAFDNAKEVDVFIDGNIVPGSPFDIDDDAPVSLVLFIPGDGLSHTILVLSNDIGGCQEEVTFVAPDCGSNCFLSGLAVNFQGGAIHNVNVDGDFFAPPSITIEAGDVVQFIWVDGGHSTTSDATSGPDSWNSGVVGIGSTYDVIITNPGVHPYYCIPHGSPGGSGMAATIVANCPAGNNFNIDVTFNTTLANAAGFNFKIDGVIQPGSPFNYNGTGPQLVSTTIAGDGVTHTIEIEDVNDPTCVISTTLAAPDCGAAPSCSLSLTAVENGPCDGANNVPVDLTVNVINGGANGFNLTVDGNTVPGSPFAYDPSGQTQLTIDVPGNGQPHNIVVTDALDGACTGSTSITTTDCAIPCQLTNLTATTGSAVTHTVLVEDFQFNPVNITISDGDIIEWDWVGVIDHTATSDATTGPDSWDSGLLGQGATYQSPVLTTGLHNYYCIPHGAPGGTGMAGTITVQANCTNGEVAVLVTFNEQGGSFGGFNVLVDGTNVGTFPYDNSGTTSVSVNVAGDGASHTIAIEDVDEAGCTVSTSITTPDCNAPTCQLTVSATENGACDANDNVPVDVTVTDVGGGASGFTVTVDGTSAGTFSYSGTGSTTVTVDVMGDGQSHSIEVTDIDEPTCNNSTTITTTNCVIPCALSNLTASTGSSVIHTVNVEDFEFIPADITISDGDIIEWDWTGVVDHTTTSDATSGADSWDSGLLGQGATYQSPVLSAGLHNYYCIPHGAPGGTGMAGTITVQANCTDGEVAVQITFDEEGGSFGGFNVLVDGTSVGTFPYDNSGTTSVSVNVVGDGASHTIAIADVDEPSCTVNTSITTPDCNAPTCQLTVSAAENGACDANDNVPVDVTVSDVGGGASGFTVTVDGTSAGTFSYSGSGSTTVTVDVMGDGQSHTIEVTDIDEPTCNNSTTVTTTNCVIPCALSNLTASTGSSVVHTVNVEDFEFIPADITISDGDIIEWDWTGVVDHTTTSDATSGADSWDSGLLGQGATYQSPVLSAGLHNYYCIPHGAPGGTGMAGTITVQANCTDGEVAVQITFDEEGGSFGGFNVLVDGTNVGTFPYDNSGTTSVSVNVVGDGASHTIAIADVDEPSCTVNTSITTPDCNAPTCQLTVSATENGACDANDNVPVDVTVTDVGGGASGFTVTIDGTSAGTFSYSGTGSTTVTVDVMGDGQSHSIEVTDIDEPTCNNSTTITTTNCVIPCALSNLTASTGSSVIHTVNVEDFEFIPADITISDGDIIEWDWTGVVDHTTTSDATSGADSWDSGLLGQGATYQSPVLSAGLHNYYCIPHGAPGGTGMAGTITVQANCTDGEVAVQITFDEEGGSFGGFNVLVDGTSVGTFPYDNSGTTSVSVNVVGDGGSHTIAIADVDEPSCTVSTSITTPDCNAPTCQLTVSAVENGACDANDNVPVDVTVSDVGGGASGFTVTVDGTSVGTFSYSGTGSTTVTVDVMGDGQSHSIEVTDIDEPTCNNSTTITTTNCVIPCALSNLTASTGSSVVHTVNVEDFEFIPADITISDGDIIEWDWTGVVDHTTTSDATSGADSWDSGLLGQGATYQSPVLSAGLHNYYCIPHGAPGGTGMAGTITVQANCTDGEVAVQITFDEEGGSFGGFNVLVDGTNVGTFPYDNSGTTSISVNVVGDGGTHTIAIADEDEPSCTISTTITTPDCNAPTCQLTVSAAENGACDGNDNVPVDVTVSDVGGGANGFTITVDGTSAGTFSYSGTGSTTVTVDVMGDGQSHSIEVTDIDEPTCNNSTTITTTNCVIPCALSNLTASTGSSVVHTVNVEDFEFIPADITISDGDIIEWDWTGVVDHTTTSDATSGADSWDSGLLGQGATYQSPVLSAGLHNYYCIPHGAPGGTGMAGTITVQANCTDGEVAVQITFDEEGGSFGGFNVLVDGTSVGTFPYDNSGTTSVSVNVVGDGASHTIAIADVDEPSCTVNTSITTPDCNAPTCQLTVSAVENGACDANDNVPVDVTVSDVGGGANGFTITVDGTSAGTFNYSGTGSTTVTVDVMGDGQSHSIEVTDIDEPTCNNSTTITTTNCVIPCALSNLTASTGSSVVHTVNVEDFEFIPADITISDGDIIEWDWTGVVDHTTTSDATSGADSWDSGLLGQGATYQSPVLSAGLHNYYCIPHGAPGGTGMAGTITVQANCTDGEVAVQITFDEEGGSFGGFNVLVDGTNVGTFPYDNSGTTSVSVNVVGDGGSHTIAIADVDEPSCTVSTSITTPDCNAPTCQLTVSATENGACDANDNVPVDVTVTDVGGGASGFTVTVDGTSAGTFSYSGSGSTTVTVDVMGDGQSHTIEVTDIDEPTCNNSTIITTTNCVIPCALSNLTASTGSSVVHTVNVEDFEFIPADITISDGDIIEWDWTGVVDHTTTSDATSGADSWDSGLLGQGATYQSPVLSAGLHNYYCIPHGAPGGTGMAGTITVQANCTDGEVAVQITFDEEGGSFGGFNVLVDGTNVGTFPYDNSGTTSVSVNVVGDGGSHTIAIADVDEPSCTVSTSITTPDCNAPTCQLTVSAAENGACDANDNVPVDVTVTDVGGGASGFTVTIDGTSAGTFSYSGTGSTTVTVDVMGDGQSHSIEVTDIDEPICNNSTTVTTTNCVIPCALSNLTASTGSSVVHTVNVEDFEFIPADITISDGDIIEWDWTGVVDHTTTSDATSGADSWDSGLLGQGATYQSPVLSAGLHNYYCIPHGAPGGTGMAGTITVQANCTDGEVAVQITFDEEGGSFGGFNVLVDGTNVGTFPYDNSGTTSVSVNVVGDGGSHTIAIADVDEPSCTVSTSITTPDCNAPTCQLTVSAAENGACDANDNVPVDVTVSDVGGGASGFTVTVDGTSVGTFSYSGTGSTTVTVDVMGDGQSHSIEVTDIDEPTCNNSTTITTTNCVIPCALSNLTASTGSSVVHTVNVEDFEFIPADITISDGDIIEWDWTGVVDHTTTSDATSGADSWDSGLLGQGATYQSPVLSAGLHNYYCIPHGAPGGTGMAGTITVQANCTDGEVAVQITFDEEGGSFGGFNVLVDGTNVGTFPYDNSGTTSISVNVVGDGGTHTIAIADEDEPSCTISTTITTPDCNAPTCQLTVSAAENGACDANDNVPVDVTVTDVGGGASGFTVTVDGTSAGTFSYSGTGSTTVTVDVMGDGQSHSIEVTDIDEPTCNNSATITTTNCVIPCQLSDLVLSDAMGGMPTTHTVLVEDFDFTPSNITVTVGDVVHFDWTGVVEHTTTSDATSGPDSWDSPLLGQGATFDVTMENIGSHPYYCIPHGNPGGIGMAGEIEVLPPCNNNEVAITITFESTNGSFNGYNVFVDGQLYTGSPFDYDAGGMNQLVVNLPGDGASHTVSIEDVDEATCALTETIVTADCGMEEPCGIAVSATTSGICDTLNQVVVSLLLDHSGVGTGFNVFVDGNLLTGSPFDYSQNNTTDLDFSLAGTGTTRLIEVVDVDSVNCMATTSILVPLCGPPCEIIDLNVSNTTTHIVEVRDFDFFPATIDVVIGDTVLFVWTGLIPHTTTSDATSGPNSWASALVGQGATFEVVVTEIGEHPYYCVPHGGPGGIGMAGVINVLENCNNGIATVGLNFETTNGSPLGYNVFLDGELIAGPIAYDDPMGYNSILIELLGDSSMHLLTVQDLEVGFCAATVSFVSPYCEVLCEVKNLSAVSGEGIVHEVEVRDFDFEPLTLDITAGETVNFIWTGDIPHTATSDALTGPDSWDSELLSTGAEYSVVIAGEGEHPYYCIPHGGPNGIGMAGSIIAAANCENGMVAVEINFEVTSGSPDGYNIFIDGSPIPENPIAYDDPTGMNSYQVEVPGDGETHLITIQDLTTSFCAATTTVDVIDCSAACNTSDLTVELTAPVTHIIEVLDFEFVPSDITINLGDTIRYVWTGAIPHTATSDATSGIDSWDSELLEQGAEYVLVLETEGEHPYYCIPHGNTGGIGMAGNINVVNNDCVNGMVSTTLQFANENGSVNGYNVFVDGLLDSGSPYFYTTTGLNEITISVVGDGASHEIIVSDVEDALCGDTISLLTPNCSTACELDLSSELITNCDSSGQSVFELTVYSQNVANAFNVLVDGELLLGSPFDYGVNDTTVVQITVPGDGLLRNVIVEDVDSLNCIASIEIISYYCTEDCNIALTATQTGNCDADNMLGYNLFVDVENPGTAFNIFLDGTPSGSNPINYDGAQTIVSTDLPGDGLTHELIVQDADDPTCTDTIQVTTIDCSEECNLIDLTIELEVPQTHEIIVEDYFFEPIYQVIEAKDTVRWNWTGVIPHTSTSDTISGPDVWNSGLLEQGDSYDYVIQTIGLHPYYCVPHGSPGGVGMAGTIEATDPVADTMMFIRITFEAVNTSLAGYQLLIDNEVLGNYNYHPSGINSVMVEVAADGEEHEVRIEDLGILDCLVDTTYQAPDFADPCYGFDAVFEAEIDHTTFEVNFTSLTNNAISWEWTFGNGDDSTEENPSYTYAEGGNYEVCLEVLDVEGCGSLFCDSISVGTYQCEAAFNYDVNGLQVIFEDASVTTETITDWEWSFGNGILLQGVPNPTYNYDTLGIYEVCLTIEGGACTDDTCMIIDLSDPCLPFEVDFDYVVNGNDYSVQFLDQTNGNANQWLWGFGDGNTSNEENPEHTYSAPGTYNVCLLVQDTILDCNQSDCVEVFVGTTGIAAPPNQNLSLSIYPNPVDKEEITWIASGLQQEDIGQIIPMKIYDARGRTIIQSELMGTEPMEISVKNVLAAGVYFLEMRGQQHVYRAKVMVH